TAWGEFLLASTLTNDQEVRTIPVVLAAAQRGMAARPDSTPELAGLDLPVLAIVGEEDQLSRPEEVQAVVDALPNARLVRIPAAAHMAPVEQPEAVSAALAGFVQAL
ncbi:MAG: hypothetical protein KDA37_18300, partial [Planctomycetales bacterium]|nr:hypothetical protein [Planctomycetales bacterium]